MRITDGNLWPIWYTQAQFNPSFASIDVHFRKRWWKEHVIVRKEPPISIVPTAKLSKASLDVAEVRLRQLHSDIVIVEIPERVTID